MLIALVLNNEKEADRALLAISKNKNLMSRIKKICGVYLEETVQRKIVEIETDANMHIVFFGELQKTLKEELENDPFGIYSELFINTSIKKKYPNDYIATHYDLILHYW